MLRFLREGSEVYGIDQKFIVLRYVNINTFILVFESFYIAEC